MKLLDEKTRVADAISRWVKRHGTDRTYILNKRDRKVGEELLRLDPNTATSAEVAEIIGNDSWAGQCRCDECGVSSWEIVQLGEEPDYESSTALVCRSCLSAALNMLGWKGER